MNGIYLNLLLREIKNDLIGSFIEDICIQDRIVQLVLNKNSVFISLYPIGLGLYLSDRVKRGYESLKNMSDVAKSCRIAKVLQHDLMPVFSLMLEKAFPNHEELQINTTFYPQAPNFSLKTQDRQRSVFARYIENEPKSSILELDAERLASVTVEHLVKNIEGIDKKMARELNPQNLNSLKEILQHEGFHPKLVSTSPLHISLFASEYEREYDSFNQLFKDAVAGFLHEREKQEAEQQKRLAIRNMKRRLVRLQKRLLSPEEIEDIRIRGELILANISKIRKGSERVKVFNPYTQSDKEIMLDPHLSPQGNAQRYFSRYKKEKRGQPKLREQIRTITKNTDDLKAQQYVREVRTGKKRTAEALKEAFHKFPLDSGSVVFVGKNARSNDELTFKHARPGDYFFHTRGFEGAHTILRPNIPKGQRPSREEIRLAASIAAYFSKAKKQSNVPVSYTQRKYLKKNKKGRIGSVVLMREEVVFVEPGLPT
jgi:predicted ribosome quality control (RQC) complex YloA/Tae2 family protein